jgi:nuclear RNA export factor
MDLDLYFQHSPSRLRHQTGRRRPGKDAPYAKPTSAGQSLSSRISGAPSSVPSGSTRGGKRGYTNLNPRRNPEGTPDVLKDRNPRHAQVQQQQHSKINEVLKGEEIKQWIRSRNIAPGVLDMSVSGKRLKAKECSKR